MSLPCLGSSSVLSLSCASSKFTSWGVDKGSVASRSKLNLFITELSLTYTHGKMHCKCPDLNSIGCYCRKIREKEASKIHVQLCIAIFCMFFFFLVGIDRTESEIGCTICSLLIQYFTMASVALMGAEALLMFHKLIIVFGHVHLVLISTIAWGE